jgi:hypothetical protein
MIPENESRSNFPFGEKLRVKRPKELKLGATSSLPCQARDAVHYFRGQWLLEYGRVGRIARLNRHTIRSYLLLSGAFTNRREAETYLDQVRDYYLAHPIQALEKKKQHVRDHGGRHLTDREILFIIQHGWEEFRAQRQAKAQKEVGE